MHVITRKRLNNFAATHPETKSALVQWYAIMRKGRFTDFVHLRQTFPHADQVGKFTVFNIGGNKVRLIAAVHYNRKKIYIRHVLTHQEYDRAHWKN
ncbi:MAG: type II toxin-antitoxin system HigB family toxin [Chthoniobacterales bacterium]